MSDGRLRAWIEPRCGGQPGFVAAFIGVPPDSDTPVPRLPATRRCTSHAEARQWVENEARALGGIEVEWVSAQ
jgi:hypothetical protein